MLNGRNHPTAGKNVALNGRGHHPLAEGDSSALYGEYEQKLASELSELLKSGGKLPEAGARALTQSPSDLIEPNDLPRIASKPTALQQAAPGKERTFVHAPRPKNDFAAASRDDKSPSFSWRHEPHPPQPSWIARQVRSALFGLGVGLIIVLPAVAVLSGRFDAWLPVQRQTVSKTETPAPLPRATQAQSPIVSAAVKTIEIQPVERQPAEAPATQVTVPATVQSPTLAFASPGSPSAAVAMPRPAPGMPSPADEASDLLASGLKLLKDGDIAGARTPLAKAANSGNAEAMYALGETFDPNMLAAWGALDVKSDASTARLYYGRAAAAGFAKAKLRLDALN